MWRKIRSNYLLKEILIYIGDRRKLNLIKYNNAMQAIVGLNLIDYRRCSGRYIIFEENGRGKEYNSYTDQLLYDGEYLKGKKNGEGKEYNYDGKLICEGEYKNGKIWEGKRIEFNYHENLIFECEYANGKRNGRGEIYNYEGKLIFVGEYKNGKRNGKGEEYDIYGNLIYEGEYINGKRNGKGKEYKDGKLIYEGEFKKGEKTGKLINDINNNKEKNYLFNRKWNVKEYDKNGNLVLEIINGNGEGKNMIQKEI